MSENFGKKIKGLFIDPLIFTQPFVNACLIHKCSGECCFYGVYTDKSEHDKIMEIRERIIATMDDSQTKEPEKWFEEPQEDDDFDSGIAYGTEVHNGKCVFLDQQGFCTLQNVAMQSGESKWKYKPLYCILFPLVIFNGALTVDTEHLERMHYCSLANNQVSTVFDACKFELIHLLGEDGYAELEQYRTEYFNQKLKAIG